MVVIVKSEANFFSLGARRRPGLLGRTRQISTGNQGLRPRISIYRISKISALPIACGGPARYFKPNLI